MTTAPPFTLHADRVVLGDGLTEPFRVVPASLRVEGLFVTEVVEEDADAWKARPTDGATALDLSDRVIAPAFIDAHTHLSMTAFRGLIGTAALRGNVVEDLFFRLEDALEEDDIRAFVRIGAFECLAHGVGLVWDHYYGGTALAEGLSDTGIASVVAPTLQDLSGPGATRTQAQLDATVALDDPAWVARGVWPALGPHATDTVSADLWQRVAAVANERNLPIHAHVAQSVEEFERSHERHDCSPTEFLHRQGVLDSGRMLLIHAIYMSGPDLDRLDPARHALGYCPLSQMQFCFPAHTPSWTAKELPWIVGSDCAASNDATNVQRELPLVAGTRGFTPATSGAYATFRSAPSPASARATDELRVDVFENLGQLCDPSFLLSRVWSVPGGMHPAFRAGVIESGALANLLVLDPGHPTMWPARDVIRTLAMADTSAAIDKMMVRGSWVKTGRELLQDPEYVEARTEADRRLALHLGKLGL